MYANCCGLLFFFSVDQFETKFWAGAPPHAKYIGRGYNIQEGLLIVVFI